MNISNGQGRSLSGIACILFSQDYVKPDELPWVMRLGFVIMALMAFGTGANDAANSWGTSVGSGAVTLTQAVVVGGLMDWLGATLLGSGVSDTIQEVTDVKSTQCWGCGQCNSKLTLLMLGMCAALLAAAIFLLLSSFTAMPVSTTHAIVGAVVGVTVTGTSFSCLRWGTLGGIVASWVTSPLLAGAVGALLHFTLMRTIISAPDADQRALRACPVLVTVTMTSMSALVMVRSPVTSHLQWWWVLATAVLVGGASFAVSYYFLVPHIKRQLVAVQVESRAVELADVAMSTALKNAATDTAYTLANDGALDEDDDAARLAEHDEDWLAQHQPTLHTQHGFEDDDYRSGEGRHGELGAAIEKDESRQEALPGMYGDQYSEEQQHALFVFRYLLVFVAGLESFAHGANDTANATGAFSALYSIYNGTELDRSCSFGRTPIWVMGIAGFFLFLGVWSLGHRVIKTMGFGLANINFFRGFCIELASAVSVVVATVLRLPVSTTHCQVGAVIFVSWTAFGHKHVKWKMFGWIGLTWVVTLPLSALLAAVLLASSEFAIKS